MTASFEGISRRCSVNDCFNATPGSSGSSTSSPSSSELGVLLLYEFVVDTSDDSTVYRWKVQENDDDSGFVRTLLDCMEPGNCTTGSEYYSYVRPSPGYFCACLPADTPIGFCRRVVFGIPRLGSMRIAINGTEWGDDEAFVGSNDMTMRGDQVTNLSAVVVGGNCPPASSSSCQGNESLLEIYQHRPRFPFNASQPLLSIDLADVSAVGPAGNRSSPTVATWNTTHSDSTSSELLYLRRCIASSVCHLLNLSAAEPPIDGNASRYHYEYGERVPTTVLLDGTYYAHQDVLLSSKNNNSRTRAVSSSLSYSTMLGRCAQSDCDGASAASATSVGGQAPGILAVTVDTNAARKGVPRGIWSWFLYDEAGATANNNATAPPLYTFSNPGRDESLFRFDRGYPATSRFQTYVCLPSTNLQNLVVAINDALPNGVTVTLAHDGEAIQCREPFMAATNVSNSDPTIPDFVPPIYVSGSSYLTSLDRSNGVVVDAVVAPLDGTCSTGSPSLSGGQIAGIAIGAVAAVVLLTLAVSAVHRRRTRILNDSKS